jgi:hypothetical protein
MAGDGTFALGAPQKVRIIWEERPWPSRTPSNRAKAP